MSLVCVSADDETISPAILKNFSPSAAATAETATARQSAKRTSELTLERIAIGKRREGRGAELEG